MITVTVTTATSSALPYNQTDDAFYSILVFFTPNVMAIFRRGHPQLGKKITIFDQSGFAIVWSTLGLGL